jgi:hypothetical protein
MRHAAMTALAALAVASAAAAQEAAPTEPDVRGFVERLTERSRAVVAEADPAAMRDWVESTFAENARIAAEGSLVTADGPTVSYEIVAGREDLARLGGMMLAGPHAAGAGIEDYALASTVDQVSELPGGGAAAVVRFVESGRILPGEAAAMPPVTFHTLALCDLRLEGAGEAVRIVIAACDATTTM